MGAARLTVWILLLLLSAQASGEAGFRGRVFLDANGNGRPDPGEAPLAGVAVSNGDQLVRSDASGQYELGASRDGFVRLTRPRGIDCDPWYRRDSGDFPCRRIQDPDAFLFVQISDAHVYPLPEDLVSFSLPRTPGWIPGFVTRPLMLFLLGRFNPELDRRQIADALRAGLPESRRGVSDSRLLPALLAEFSRPGSESGRVAAMIRDAFDELAALGPEFVISTGDLILEGNQATPDAARRWMALYLAEVERMEQAGIPFFHTLGNNELVASDRREEFPDDPDTGKGLYQRLLGPTRYSFDRGAMHFVVTDTHLLWPRGVSFYRLDPHQRRRLEADALAHGDTPVAVLNHEPWAWDPEDRMDVTLARDEGLLARSGVDYAISGHIHRNGVWHDGVTTHISTGALSGMRWFLPAGFVERGLRLFWLDGERLFSAWKQLGHPALGFVAPGHGPPLWPSGAERARPDELVVFAADRAGPFAELTLLADGEPVALEAMGRYFGRAQRTGETTRFVLVARRTDGSEERAEWVAQAGRGAE